jgi:hypothetical protein
MTFKKKTDLDPDPDHPKTTWIRIQRSLKHWLNKTLFDVNKVGSSSSSDKLKAFRIRPDTDPQHWCSAVFVISIRILFSNIVLFYANLVVCAVQVWNIA